MSIGVGTVKRASVGARSHDGPVVAVYRRSLLARSETFVRDEALALRRYSPLFVGVQRQDGLDLPADRVVVPASRTRLAAAVRRRLPGHDPQREIAKECAARGVRIIHAHFGPDGVSALDLAQSLDVPLIVTFWGFDASMSDDDLLAADAGLSDYVHRRSELFQRASLMIAVSQFLADELRGLGAPDSKLRVHHVGVPLGPFTDQNDRDPVVLFVGRDVEKKGLGDLIDAMAQVRRSVSDARLVVIGDGPLRRAHEARARELGVDADFLGWLTPAEVREHLTTARVLCVPSRRAANGDAEGLPTVIPEAGAYGLPVVGTRHSGIPEAIGDGRGGLLADEGDTAGIARHLAAVLADLDLWRELSQTGRDNVAQNFDPERQASEMEGLYDEVLAGAA